MTPLEKAKTRILDQDDQPEKNVKFLSIYPELSSDLYQTLLDIQNILNIDESKDLDLIGRIIGVERKHEERVLNGNSIGYEDAICGNDYAICEAIDWSQATDLSNEIYKMILKSKVIKNHSDTTISDIELGVSQLIQSSDVIVIDGKDMTFRLVFDGTLTDVERYAIEEYDIIPRPQGVEFLGYIETETTPLVGDLFAVCGNERAVCTEII